MSATTFERTGELMAIGGDFRGRNDCVEFIARAGLPTIDWLAETFVTVSAWGTRFGVASILDEQDGGAWAPEAQSLPFDAMYVVREMEIRLVFGSYVRLQPGRRYRLFLPGAVVTSPTIKIVALVRQPEVSSRRVRTRVRRAS